MYRPKKCINSTKSKELMFSHLKFCLFSIITRVSGFESESPK